MLPSVPMWRDHADFAFLHSLDPKQPHAPRQSGPSPQCQL